MLSLFETLQRWQILDLENGFSDSPNNRNIHLSIHTLGKMNRSGKRPGKNKRIFYKQIYVLETVKTYLEQFGLGITDFKKKSIKWIFLIGVSSATEGISRISFLEIFEQR